jgi:hypothetical protein
MAEYSFHAGLDLVGILHLLAFCSSDLSLYGQLAVQKSAAQYIHSCTTSFDNVCERRLCSGDFWWLATPAILK